MYSRQRSAADSHGGYLRLGADQPLVAPGSGPHKVHAVPQFVTNSGHKANSTQLAAFVTNTARPNVSLPPSAPGGQCPGRRPHPRPGVPRSGGEDVLPPGRAAATGPSNGSRRASSCRRASRRGRLLLIGHVAPTGLPRHRLATAPASGSTQARRSEARAQQDLLCACAGIPACVALLRLLGVAECCLEAGCRRPAVDRGAHWAPVAG
jgi:hypothetical protein